MAEQVAYIVGGDCGEYSDHNAWWVRVFLEKPSADALCERLNAWCRERRLLTGDNGKCSASWDRAERPPEDPQFNTDYTGTRYSVVEVPLETAASFRVGT